MEIINKDTAFHWDAPLDILGVPMAGMEGKKEVNI